MLTLDRLNAYGANTQDGLTRCVNNEMFYFSLIMRAVEDPAIAGLGESLAQQDYAKAFDQAHRLKGVMANLALDPITGPVSALTELLRHQTPGDYAGLYAELLDQIKALKALIAS